MGWKKGPLPAGTWHWGGVQLHDTANPNGFYFADFNGDHVRLPMLNNKRIEAHEIKLYNNALTLPIHVDEDGKWGDLLAE